MCIRDRYGDPLSDEVKERLVFELYIMKTMGFPGYFLIVQDLYAGYMGVKVRLFNNQRLCFAEMLTKVDP